MKCNPLTKCVLAAVVLLSVAQTLQAGKLRRLLYYNYSGSAVTNLFGTNVFGVQAFPDMPDGADFMPPALYIGNPPNPPYTAEAATNFADTYGDWSRGYLTAPETGTYIFWLASDDEGQFWMTTDPADPRNPAKTNLICRVPLYSGPREWNKFPEQQSAPVYLEQGKTYYVELFHKEGTGNDHFALGWQTPSGTLEQPMPAWHFQPVRDTRWGEPDVELVLGPVVPKNPGDFSVYDGMRTVAFVNANLDPPLTYQWFRDGTSIPGATNAYYLLRANISDNFSQWSVQVTSGGTVYTAGPTALYVYNDKPTVVSASVVPQNPTRVQVTFSEDVSPATATNTANYTLSGATIQSATLGTDSRTVTLATSFLLANRVYTLDVSNVQDMATPVNTMDPASVNFVIADGSIYFRIYYASMASDLATLRTWSAANSVNSTYTNNAYSEQRLITTTSYPWNLAPLRDGYEGQMIGFITAPETGNYRFAIASDDHSILYLGTNDLRSSKKEVCNYNGSTGRWTLGAQTNQVSTNIFLEAGKRYYFEAVYRDGTGGDGVTVAWQRPSDPPLPTSNPGVQSETQPFLIPAQYLSPFTAYTNVFFRTNLSATLAAAESARPTLRVAVDGILPYSYQWFKNGAAITNANADSYTLPFVRPADNGATFFVVVTNNFSSVTSVVTTLTVTSDTTKPAIASVGSLFKQLVEVRFTEPVTAATASNTANYSLLNSAGAPVAINAAVVDTNDATHVTLQTAAMPETDLMQLAVRNMADLSGNANIMNPVTNVFRANNFDSTERINNTQAWSVGANADQVLMTAGGSDIWGSADQCVFLYKTVTGNFDYKVQGVSLPAVNAWCKMGLMVRQSTAAGARNAFTLFAPSTPGQNTYSPQIRDATGGTSTSSGDVGSPLNVNLLGGVPQRPTIAYPSWLRLQRIGNSFYWYYSSNGTNWTWWTSYDSSATSTEGALPATLLLGLALTSHDTGRTVDGTMASFTAVNDGPLRLTLQPTNTTVVEGGTVSFAAAVAGNSPWLYQWLTNGIALADATNATLTLTRVPYSFNGFQIACRISNPYGEIVTSTNALLTVVKDVTAPTVRYYVMPKINLNPTEVRLLYSEPMDKTSAETLANYQITTSPGAVPLTISFAVLDVDERTVILTTAPQTVGTTYRVVVNNVVDQACCPPNAVPINSTDYFYYAGSQGRFLQRADGFVFMEAENAQRITTGTTPATDWQLRTIRPGYSGTGYMVVTNVGGTTGGTTISGGVGQGTGPKMEYDILFNFPATNYTLWIRGWVQDTNNAGNDDSIFVGLDGNLVYLGPNTNDANYSQMTSWGAGGWDWRSDRSSGTDPLVLSNVTAGVHTLVIWQREDGALIDKICLEPGVRSNAGNSTEPSQASGNGGLGDPETWDWLVAPPAPPTIAIINPTNGQAFAGASSIPIQTSIAAPSPITLVEFFSGTNLIGTAASAPFSMTWQNVPEGIYTLTARATDVLGYQTTSAAVQVIVDSTRPVAYAVGSLRGSGIGVYFRDLSGLDPASATNLSNYVVNGGAVSVSNAVLEPDNLAVMLALAAPISGSFSVQVSNVADRGFGPNIMAPVTLQSTVLSWPLNQDIGTPDTNNPALFSDPILPGFAQAIDTNGFYVRAGGHDVWDLADGMHFVYLPVTGNFDVAVRVASLLLADPWSKAGLMVREDLDGNSRNLLIATAPTNGQNVITMQWRPVKGATSVSIPTASRPQPSPIPNAWLRTTRTNDLFTFYYGTNGVDWISLFTTNTAAAPYPGTAYVGVATTSHNNGTNAANQTAAYYRNLTGLAAPAPASPALSVQVVGSNLAISWTSTSSGFVLQSTAALGTGNWQSVPTPPVIVGNTYTVTVPISASQQFYRLRY